MSSSRPGEASITSPNDLSGGNIRSPFGLPPGLTPQVSKMSGVTRSGAGSPSHEMAASSRMYKRAREIQAQEGIAGLPANPWIGPPTSGNSTPLRENIPESPTDGFPDFAPQVPALDSVPQTRRARAGTVPSRFSPGGIGSGLLNVPGGLPPKTSLPTPAHTPYKSPSPGLDPTNSSNGGNTSSTLLSRLRAGSMPQRSPFAHGPGTSSPFGPSVFSSWNPTGRDRGNTLASIASVGSNGPSSPAQSLFSREGTADNDVHMRTLDYLGLAETPQPPRAQLATPWIPALAELKAANRFRSYSVNNKDKYADDDEEYEDEMMQMERYVQDQLAVTNAAIRNHNLAVHVLATQTANRPRARTAGVLESPVRSGMRSYIPTQSRLDNSVSAAEIRLTEDREYDDLPQAVAAMSLNQPNGRSNGLLGAEESSLEGPTSALWLGSIPTSTTQSTLTELFKNFGPIHSARVLTHKNCGFVNFEMIESAVAAKATMNGKEIFPGAGPVRINFAKPPSASNTPGHDGVFPSPSPDPFAKGHNGGAGAGGPGAAGESAAASLLANTTPKVPPLHEMTADILHIVKQFGATDEEQFRISTSLQSAINYTAFIDEIPPIKDPAHTRIHDAPKLRDIRKRIDNGALTTNDIENIAVEMLPEIAELASDYLGNTVVQKLFEHCSDSVRDLMLAEIAPHMAEIGVHKNGTWAAQKIIDVCKTPHQLSLIVQHLRPYTIPLFLDQYGNYVLQGCLKFGAPYDDFIFESMLSRMWEIAQGRYGARAMRACLESHHATKDQQRMLAAAIALHSVQLATNANGALLLTWFLDTCTFPQRRTVLSPQIVPYLVHLCTHKVAYLTVLKLINQKAEAEARETIMNALFFTPSDQVLEAILSDHVCGATLIFKVLTTPFFDETMRAQVVDNVKTVLVRIKAQPNQGYKRLMDEVGLSTRNGGGSREERPRPASRQASGHIPQNSQGQQQQHQTAQQQQQSQQGFGANGGQHYYNPLSASTYDVGFGIPRSESAEPGMPQQFPAFSAQPAIYSSPGAPIPPAGLPQAMQYPQMNRGNNSYFPAMQAGYAGYPSQNLANGNPIQGQGAQISSMPNGQLQFGVATGGATGFGVNMVGGGLNYGGMQSPYAQEPVNSRRGRVG